MRRSQQLITFGVILVIVGLLLLVLGNVEGEGFVFVFPFFFSTGSSAFPLFLVLGVFILMLILLWVLQIGTCLKYGEENGVLALEEQPSSFKICSVCGDRVLNKANFCSNCGNQMSSSNHNDEHY
ncbi:MAG: hypothetical protein RTU30_06275 [Candidatus Thorarchaeota archaeon]